MCLTDVQAQRFVQACWLLHVTRKKTRQKCNNKTNKNEGYEMMARELWQITLSKGVSVWGMYFQALSEEQEAP